MTIIKARAPVFNPAGWSVFYPDTLLKIHYNGIKRSKANKMLMTKMDDYLSLLLK